ncbi:hypothetical protein EG329_008422 [Mollisiaceae sp. DMI_Dod_QoI]|nr:hypothetical protein EG329_008422 [Helotiales sp. DMI_Dod_QoI]
MAFTSVLVLGPTGGLGQFLIPELIRRKPSFDRIGAFIDLTRPQSTKKARILQGYTENGVELVESSPGDPTPFKGFQVVIACLGNHAIKNQPSLIDTALAAGVRHWYPSEFGADLTIGDNWNERYYRDKVITRIHLQKRASENPEFGYTYFLDGRFTEWAPTPHFGIDMKTHIAHIVGQPEMEQTLLSVKETLEKIQGVKWKITFRSVEEARESQRKAIETGDVDAELAASHQVIQGTGRTLLPGPYDNNKFPEVKPMGLEDTWCAMLEDTSRFPLLEL